MRASVYVEILTSQPSVCTAQKVLKSRGRIELTHLHEGTAILFLLLLLLCSVIFLMMCLCLCSQGLCLLLALLALLLAPTVPQHAHAKHPRCLCCCFPLMLHRRSCPRHAPFCSPRFSLSHNTALSTIPCVTVVCVRTLAAAEHKWERRAMVARPNGVVVLAGREENFMVVTIMLLVLGQSCCRGCCVSCSYCRCCNGVLPQADVGSRRGWCIETWISSYAPSSIGSLSTSCSGCWAA